MDIAQAFDERLEEINAYLTLLETLERQARDGPPKIGGETITTQQQRILYSSVYLQLYNLVEATASWCVKAVVDAATNGGRWQPGHLTAEFRREWIRYAAKTHVDQNADNRLKTVVEFCDHLIQSKPVTPWNIERGGGGNWDDMALEGIAERIGLDLRVSTAAYTAVKRKIREDRGALGLVKYLRNQLAHGQLSFSDCGDSVTVTDLKALKDVAEIYLREVVRLFGEFIDGHGFLLPNYRPVGGGSE